MMNWFKHLRNMPMYKYVVGENHKYLTFFLLCLLPNFIASLLEGISYLCLLLAFNVFSGQELGFIAHRKWNFLFSFFYDMSTNRQFVFLVIIALAIQCFRSLMVFLSQYLTSKVSLKILIDLQAAIYRQIFNFSYGHVSGYNNSDLSLYAASPESIPQIMSSITNFFVSLLLSLTSIGIMFFINIKLSLITLSSFLFVNFLYKFLIKKMHAISIKYTENTISFGNQASQYLSNMKLIHILGFQQKISNVIKTLLVKMSYFNNKLNLWSQIGASVNEIVSILVVSLMLLIGALILPKDPKFLTLLLLFIGISYRLATRLQLGYNHLLEIARNVGNLNRINNILSCENKEFMPTGGTIFKSLNKTIKFENVSFNYKTRTNLALKDFSIEFLKNRLYGIVGKSGAGKSTFIDLMLRLYDPSNGRILVDNIDIRDLEINSWRKVFGVVSQDAYVFYDTIENNIKFSYESATHEEVVEAAKKANLHDLVEKFPEGYKTIVGERGIKLSGGEKQRLILARALVSNPQILVLDEATSHLDSHSEYLIQNALEEIRKDKTVFVIAHRLSTIEKADEILVFDKGRLIEKGHHEELSKHKGAYYYFWTIQTKARKENKNIFEPLILGTTSDKT